MNARRIETEDVRPQEKVEHLRTGELLVEQGDLRMIANYPADVAGGQWLLPGRAQDQPRVREVALDLEKAHDRLEAAAQEEIAPALMPRIGEQDLHLLLRGP